MDMKKQILGSMLMLSGLASAMDSPTWGDNQSVKSSLDNKQKKKRARNKMAKLSRKRNRNK